ncbi:MAG: anti-sigma factor family protein [Novosphingobium sp.]
MSNTDDDYLSAFLDGALPPDEAARFEARLAADPALAARVEALRANDSFMAQAFAPLAQATIDAETLAKLGLAPAVPQAANDNPPWWRGRALPLVGGSLAAGLALVLVLTGRPHAPNDDGLSVALETTPSLKTAELADGSTVEPRLTVRAADGRWCREYVRGDVEALACREKSGWKVIDQAAAPKGEGVQGDVVLASGADAASLSSAYASIGASDPLDAAAEAKAMVSGWKPQ